MSSIRSVNRRHKRAIVALTTRTRREREAVIEAPKPVETAN